MFLHQLRGEPGVRQLAGQAGVDQIRVDGRVHQEGSQSPSRGQPEETVADGEGVEESPEDGEDHDGDKIIEECLVVQSQGGVQDDGRQEEIKEKFCRELREGMVIFVFFLHPVINDHVLDDDASNDPNKYEDTGLRQHVGQEGDVVEDDLQDHSGEDHSGEHYGVGIFRPSEGSETDSVMITMGFMFSANIRHISVPCFMVSCIMVTTIMVLCTMVVMLKYALYICYALLMLRSLHSNTVNGAYLIR